MRSCAQFIKIFYLNFQNCELNSFSLNFIYRYDSTTGSFTVPSGGDGFYYFSVYLLVHNGEYSRFDI